MKKYLYIPALFFILVMFGATHAFAQTTKVDSLQKLLFTQKEDTNKVITLNKLGREMELSGNYEKGINYAKEAIGLGEKINYKKGVSTAYKNLGNINTAQGNYPQALSNHLASLKLSEELSDKAGIAGTLGNIGTVYGAQTDYVKALDYYFKSLKMSEELGNKKLIASSLGNIGTIYKEQADYPKALDYYFKSLKLKEELKNKNGIAITLGNIGIVYKQQAAGTSEVKAKAELFDKALQYYLKALNMSEELGDKNGITRHLGNIGALLVKMGNADQSVSIKKYNEAEKYLNQALALSKEIGALNLVRDQYKFYTELDSALSKKETVLGNFALALKYSEASLEHYKKYIAARDSIANEENIKKQTRAEMNFEFDKKEALAKEEQKKKDALAAAEAKKQRLILVLISCFLILVLILALIIFRSLRVNQHKSKIISHQKAVVEKQKQFVEEKQKEILDSIHYAKRIQTALITSEKYIARQLARHREF